MGVCIGRRLAFVKKENLQIAMLTIAIGAGAVTYASNSRSVIFFAITWVIGMLTAILIQFLWYKKPIAAVGLVLVSFAIAGLAALALHYLIGI